MTPRDRIHGMAQWLKRVVTEPRSELTRWQYAVRYAYDLARYGARQLRRDRAPQMAGALAFRTLFGFLPVVVVGTVLARALMGPAEFRAFLSNAIAVFVENYGFDEVSVSGAGGELESLTAFLQRLVDPVVQLNLTAIGWIGIGIVIYSAISLMVTIENSFNAICRAPEGRSWVRRIPLYWFVLTVAPIAFAATTYVNGQFTDLLAPLQADEGSGGWVAFLLRVVAILWSFAATWVMLAIIYVLVPTAHLGLRSALIGAFVSAVILEAGRGTLQSYVINAVSLRQLYGSLGLIPLFMFWVYLMWLAVLFGLEVASTLHAFGGRAVEDIDKQQRVAGMLDPTSVISIMEVVAEGFDESRPTSPRRIAEVTAIPEPAVVAILDRLVEGGFLHRLDRQDRAVTLARAADRIDAAGLLQVGWGLVDQSPGQHTSPLIGRLHDAQTELAKRFTLATLLAAPGPVATGDQA